MKNLLVYSLLLTFLPIMCLRAQTIPNCSTVTAQNQAYCCSGDPNDPNKVACNAYRNGYGGTSTTQQPQTQQPFIGGPQCGTIDRFNYDSCCKTFYRSQNIGRCSTYETIGDITVGSDGTPTVKAVNVINYSSDSAQTGTSQVGASDLKECSAIKFKSILDILVWIKCIIVVAIIPLLFALATLFFMWGVFKYIQTSDSTKRKEAQKTIFAGLVGLFVMTSLWGIINIIGTTLGTGSAVPLLQTSSLKKTP